MSKIIPMGILQKDIEIYEKMLISSDYFIDLKLVNEITKALEINSKELYYRYQIVLRQLECFNYYEATIFSRLENTQYHNMVKSLSEYKPVKEKRIKYCNIIQFPNRIQN